MGRSLLLLLANGPVLDAFEHPARPVRSVLDAFEHSAASAVARRGFLGGAGPAVPAVARRGFLGAAAATLWPAVASAGGLEDRDRGMNEKALLQSDFYFTTGRKPPRKLDLANLPTDDPKWNAWGECAKSGSTNACTYVPLAQRYNAYSKYASTVLAGAQDFAEIGLRLRRGKPQDLDAVALLLDPGAQGRAPAPTRAAGRQALLLADALLISANSGSLGREILVARFYVNELHFATEAVAAALAQEEPDLPRALDAWALGVDSYNSYFCVVNKNIVPKVGDKFPALPQASA